MKIPIYIEDDVLRDIGETAIIIEKITGEKEDDLNSVLRISLGIAKGALYKILSQKDTKSRSKKERSREKQ